MINVRWHPANILPGTTRTQLFLCHYKVIVNIYKYHKINYFMKKDAGFVVDIFYFKDMADVYKKITEYFQEYNPRGYGTNINLYLDLAKDLWVLEMERYDSCD